MNKTKLQKYVRINNNTTFDGLSPMSLKHKLKNAKLEKLGLFEYQNNNFCEILEQRQ